MKSLKLLLVVILIPFYLAAQEVKIKIAPEFAEKNNIQIPYKKSALPPVKAKDLIPSLATPDYDVSIINLEKINPRNKQLEIEKERKTKLKQNYENYKTASENATSLITPVIGTNFTANQYNFFFPPDNNIAVSDNHIVSVMNSNIYIFSKTGNRLYSASFSAFFNNQYTAILYDPLVAYDPTSKRFILVVLHGNDPTTSKVIVAISKTSDPTQGWWTYEITGDVNQQGEWFDYPKLAVNQDDIYVTGNLYNANNIFTQAVILQIDKASVLNGGQIQGTVWTGITNSPFTLLPLPHGISSYGPGIYLIAISDGTISDRILLYDITSNATDPNTQINAYVVNTNQNITIGGDALQNGTNKTLDAGDTRALSGFYLNGVIHFVHNNEYLNNFNGISYHRITVQNLSDWYITFGADGYDYCYPAVAWAGTNTNDKSVIIGFLRSAQNIFPEMRVVACDDQGNFSNSVLVKQGTGFIDIDNTTNKERWGDYTGAARDPATGKIWIAGAYGNSNNNWTSYIAEIATSASANINNKNNSIQNFVTYPNPAKNYFSTKFYLNKAQVITIKLLTTDGKEVKTLLHDKIKQGNNLLRFSINSLPTGTYLLNILDNNKNLLHSEKIIINK